MSVNIKYRHMSFRITFISYVLRSSDAQDFIKHLYKQTQSQAHIYF